MTRAVAIRLVPRSTARVLLLSACLAIWFAALLAPALAVDGPHPVATTGDSVVSFELGPWILAFSNMFFQIFAPIACAMITGWIYTKWPWAKAFVSEALIEKQVGQFVDYAQNAEAGVVKGMHLDVNLGQSVLGTAVAQAMVKADANVMAAKAVKWAGGPEGIAKRVFKELNLNADASAANVLVPVIKQIEDGTLLPHKIATLKVVPTKPSKVPVVPKVPHGGPVVIPPTKKS